MKNLNLKALFVGDKAENRDFYENQMSRLVNEHMGWREDYIPSDMAAISEEEKEQQMCIRDRSQGDGPRRRAGAGPRQRSAPEQEAVSYTHLCRDGRAAARGFQG